MNNKYDKTLLIGGTVALIGGIVSWATSFDFGISLGLTLIGLILLTGAST